MQTELSKTDSVLNLGRAKIMIVDDDPDIQRLVGYNLTQAGFQVLSASSGRTTFTPAGSSSFKSATSGLSLDRMLEKTITVRSPSLSSISARRI